MLKLRAHKGPSKVAARALHSAAVSQAREPVFYLALGVSDTPEGRFEALTLHIVMLIHRLNAPSSDLGDLSQRVFDVYVSDLDGAMREMGVGDLAMSKRMRALGEAFYGRATAYDAYSRNALENDQWAAFLHRTVLEDRPGTDTTLLQDYVRACRKSLRTQTDENLGAGRVTWPTP